MPCGLSINISSLRSGILSKVATITALSGLIGLPAGQIAIKGILASAIASVKLDLKNLLPDIPLVGDLTSLRDKLGDFANGIETDINGLIGDFGDIVNLDGLANTDLANLVQSAISTAQNFDPCSLASGIPNVVKDASGNLFSLPEPAFIGQTDYGSVFGDVLETYDYIDDAVEGVKGNITDINSLIGDAKGAINTMTTLTDLTNIRNALESNVSGAISSMGQSLKKTASGDTVLQSVDEYRQELIGFRKHLPEW
tara:strand:- start:12 stop:776 length:765 start_codon:yes stop_codon:yes gene_type:complete